MAGDGNINRRITGAAEESVSGPGWAGVEMSDLKTFLRLAEDYRKFVGEAQQRINALVERNEDLEKNWPIM